MAINNVIHFPAKSSGETVGTMSINRTRFLLSTSLVTVLFFVFVANTQLLRPQKIVGYSDMSSRAIASVSNRADSNTDWEKKLAKQLSVSAVRRDLASIGKRPSALEELQFGLLEGKYAMQLDNEKISKFEFSESVAGADRPKYVTDRAMFIEQYRGLFIKKFASFRLSDDTITNDEVHENYDLFDEKNNRIGSIAIKMDIYGRLISLNVE